MATGVEELVELGRRVRRLREAQGLSQEDVSRPAFSAAYLSHIENGKRRASHETLSHIAGRLGVTVGQLLTGRDPDDDLRLEIDIQRAISSIHLGEAATARARLERARREAVDASNERALLRADEGLGLALYRLGEHDRAYGSGGADLLSGWASTLSVQTRRPSPSPAPTRDSPGRTATFRAGGPHRAGSDLRRHDPALC
jgi:transcriptional regulator with XRE-family HTH domain